MRVLAAPFAIAEQFVHQGVVREVTPLGSGNINDTFLVILDGAPEPYFVLQRLNTQIFRDPRGVMQNMRTVTEHVHDRLSCNPADPHCPDRRWEVPRVLPTQAQQDCHTDGQDVWRALSFIDRSHTLDQIQDTHHAQEIGYGLGMFHHLISDLPTAQMVDTLEGFHITPRYLQQFDAVLAKSPVERNAAVEDCLRFVGDRRAFVPILEQAKAAGKLHLRLIHGDPKINNIMLDTVTGQAVSMIDLDTVKPGLVHYDIGDCLRSGCNPLGEETEAFESVRFEPDLAEPILQGYWSVARAFLTTADCEYLYDAIRLIAFELGLRFLTDHLAGNVYFKAKHPTHNLARAQVQFRLTESIEAQEQTLRNLIESLR
ncbi:MAG: aminoglycoside phosphotransferase family protein [Synechococcales cyanobacterium CRU_2_2]|nr:aminoglycoside phosphotransferase family protein [Synechococcales cyanobacterium CRU_2_2]